MPPAFSRRWALSRLRSSAALRARSLKALRCSRRELNLSCRLRRSGFASSAAGAGAVVVWLLASAAGIVRRVLRRGLQEDCEDVWKIQGSGGERLDPDAVVAGAGGPWQFDGFRGAAGDLHGALGGLRAPDHEDDAQRGGGAVVADRPHGRGRSE